MEEENRKGGLDYSGGGVLYELDFSDKGPYSQGYGLSGSHVRM